MERKIGFPSFFAFSSASGPHSYQSTGLWACWRRYGLVAPLRRFARRCPGWPSARIPRTCHAVAHKTTSATAAPESTSLHRRDRRLILILILLHLISRFTLTLPAQPGEHGQAARNED